MTNIKVFFCLFFRTLFYQSYRFSIESVYSVTHHLSPQVHICPANRRHVAAEDSRSLRAAGVPRAAGLSLLRCAISGQADRQSAAERQQRRSVREVLHQGQDAVQVERESRRGRGEAAGHVREPGGAHQRRGYRPAM